jgi:hypothetical protein
MRASEVFTPNKLPDVTFIDDHLKEATKTLRQALETGAAVVSLSGPSKSGKTVFIEKTLGKENLIQVTGAGADSPAKLWDRVFGIIGTPTRGSTTGGSGFTGTIGAKAATGVPLVVSGEASASGAWAKTEATSTDYAPDYLQLLIKELGGTDFVVFIDDFHYIPTAVQQQVANEIKEAIRGGVRFICAAVPYHSDDVLRANSDLRGRIFKLDFDYWSVPNLKKIAALGFEALNATASDALSEAFAREAAGSPQLMQSLCLSACFELGLEDRSTEPITIQADLDLISRSCRRTMMTTDYSSTVEKLKEGPKTRGTIRNSHRMLDGTVKDVYPIILGAIAANPPELTIRYQNLQVRIASVCEGDPPSGSSVTGACVHISDIANDAENRQVIEWDAANDVLDIRDPYLLFFLRWADWK